MNEDKRSVIGLIMILYLHNICPIFNLKCFLTYFINCIENISLQLQDLTVPETSYPMRRC